MAKLTRERTVKERRERKQEKKRERKLAAAADRGEGVVDPLADTDGTDGTTELVTAVEPREVTDTIA